MSSPISIFIKELFSDNLVFLREIDDTIIFDFDYRFNGSIIHGSIDIEKEKHGFYIINESDISVPFPKITIPTVLQKLIDETDIHIHILDEDTYYHHHFITKVPVSLNQLKSILKYFYKLYLFGEWYFEE